MDRLVAVNPTPVATVPDYAQIDWGEDGLPRSPRYRDVYHSTAGAIGQCEHVFIAGNRLRDRWWTNQRFAIGELGFGSGLNFLTTSRAWLEHASPGHTLHYCAIERHPWTVEDSDRLFSATRLSSPLVQEWLATLQNLQVGANRFVLAQGRIHLTLHIGDAADVLPRLRGRLDAWYLDGFNPRTNDAMWSPQLFAQLHRCSAPGSTLASWCCAGSVRRGLADAGFEVTKAAGYANKREMLTAVLPGAPSPRTVCKRVQIVGAGVAGAWLARELAERGIAVEIYDRAHGPGRGASGMPMLMIRPFARHRDTPTARFFWQAAALAVRRTADLQLHSWTETPIWRSFGDEPAHWLAPAGWCDGRELCATLLDHPAITAYWNHDIPGAEAWACRLDPTIFCTAGFRNGGLGDAQAIRPIRGQQSLWHDNQGQLGEHTPRVGDCVAAQAPEGLYFGATHRPDDAGLDVRPEEALSYGRSLPHPPGVEDLAAMTHWAAVRQQSRDRLPCCGPAPQTQTFAHQAREAGKATVGDILPQRNVWMNLAHGSRGATSAVLCAVMLADQLEALPAPVLADEQDALDPRRFILRDWRRGKLRFTQET